VPRQNTDITLLDNRLFGLLEHINSVTQRGSEEDTAEGSTPKERKEGWTKIINFDEDDRPSNGFIVN